MYPPPALQSLHARRFSSTFYFSSAYTSAVIVALFFRPLHLPPLKNHTLSPAVFDCKLCILLCAPLIELSVLAADRSIPLRYVAMHFSTTAHCFLAFTMLTTFLQYARFTHADRNFPLRYVAMHFSSAASFFLAYTVLNAFLHNSNMIHDSMGRCCSQAT